MLASSRECLARDLVDGPAKTFQGALNNPVLYAVSEAEMPWSPEAGSWHSENVLLEKNIHKLNVVSYGGFWEEIESPFRLKK